MTKKEMSEKRARVFEEMKAILKKQHDENRSLTADESETWDRLKADTDKLTKDIERVDYTETMERTLSDVPPVPQSRQAGDLQPDPKTTEERNREESRAFEAYIRYGLEGMTPEQRGTLARKRDQRDAVTPQTVSTTGGGYLIPQGFSNDLEKRLVAYGSVRSVARILATPTGADIEWPTVDDTSNTGELLAINTEAAHASVTYSHVTLKAYKFSSKEVLVPNELLQDSFFNINAHLADLLADRIARITNTYFTTGSTGATEPKGVITCAGTGKTGEVGTDAAPTYANLVDLVHSLDPSYRIGARFMFNDTVFGAIQKLTDDFGRPLWQPFGVSGMSAGVPDTILGYPYTINQQMADGAAGAKSVLFGNFSKYIVRDVLPFTLRRLDQLFGLVDQTAFIAFSRHDGRSIQDTAFKVYINGAAS